VVLAVFLVAGSCAAQELSVENPDSISVSVHDPGGALRRAAAVPGWGQIYNRQYLKLPVLYGAMGGLIFAVIRLSSDYALYRKAFQYKAFQELVDTGSLESNPRENFRSSYETLVGKFGPISSRPIGARRDNLRRNRDLSILGVGLVYGLSILDAFVSAHLMDFNVDDNLAFGLDADYAGVRITAKISLSD
jgi:Family of unknown function (DUF5683)